MSIISKAIALAVIAVVAVGAALTLTPKIGGTPAIDTATTTTTSGPPAGHTTSTYYTATSGITTTTDEGAVPQSNAWAITDEVGGLWLTSEPPELPRESPVYVNGSFMDFHSIRAVFNLSVGDESSNFVISWRMSRGPYTATCYNYFNGEYVERDVSDALILNTQYVFDDGYWFNATVYLPNASMIWAFNNPPLIRFDIHATPHGAQHDVLGAVIESSDPGNQGRWSSSQPLLSPDEASKCNPVVDGSPEAYSLIQHLGPWLNLQLTTLLEPLEGVQALSYLGEKQTEHFTSSDDLLYHEGVVRMTYLGTEEYPGTGVVMHIYNVSFTTDTGNLVVWMKVAAESIIPIEYHARYPKGEVLQGTPVSIDIKVLNAELGPPLSPE